MLPALVSLKNLIKTKSYHIDLPFFRLHYQATVCLLLGFCLILTPKILFGDTIDCSTRIEKDSNYFDNICYSTGTYTRYKMIEQDAKVIHYQNILTNSTFRVDPDSKFIYSGIMIGSQNQPRTKILWHSYYQYMPIMLFLQAVLFYFPHYLWKIWENGTVSSVCKHLYDNRFAPNEYFETNFEIIYYLQNCFKLNKSLVYKYHLCHVLLLLNMVLQILALNTIFNQQFISYGYMVFKYWFIDEDVYGLKRFNTENVALQQKELNNPMDLVFPKLTSCRIQVPSQAGLKPEELEFLCVLPLNILHDKFFLLLWFWFLVLGVLTILQIIKNLLYTTLPQFRKYLFKRNYGGSRDWVSDYRRSSDLSELFILDLIGNNSDKYAFSALIRKLNKTEGDWTANPSESHSVV